MKKQENQNKKHFDPSNIALTVSFVLLAGALTFAGYKTINEKKEAKSIAAQNKQVRQEDMRRRVDQISTKRPHSKDKFDIFDTYKIIYMKNGNPCLDAKLILDPRPYFYYHDEVSGRNYYTVYPLDRYGNPDGHSWDFEGAAYKHKQVSPIIDTIRKNINAAYKKQNTERLKRLALREKYKLGFKQLNPNTFSR